MSFMRVPRRSQSLTSRPKKTKKKKPSWDNTTSDLTVHKLSKEELDHRHAVHQSANLDIIKEEKRRKALLKAKKQRSMSEGNQAGLLREILYDEKQLNDALAHSDRVMSVVKDLFYDDPKRLKAVPHITRAPGGDAERRRAGPISERGPHTSYLDVLSESVMDPSALNEYQEDNDSEEEEGTEDEDEEEEEEEESPVFDSKLDVDRFQSYIHKAAAEPHEKEEKIQPKHRSNKENIDPAVTPEKSPLSNKRQKALNNTAKAKKKMKSRSKGEGSSLLLNITQKTTPEDLRTYLSELMTACSAFDRARGDVSDVSHSFSSGFPQLSGYTAFLVQTLTKILKHLSEKETQLVQERESQRRLEEELIQQRQIIDAMTVDMMQSQELNMKIQAEARKQINQMEQRLQIVEHLLASREFSDDSVLPPTSGRDVEDVPVQGLTVNQHQESKPVPTASAATTVYSASSSENNPVQPAGLISSTSEITSSAPDSLPATLEQPTLPSNKTVHTTAPGKPGSKLSTSLAQSSVDQVLKGTDASVQKVSSGHHIPQLSQHTMERLMSSRPVQGTGSVHLAGNLRHVQTNVPSGIQSRGPLQSDNVQRPIHEMSSRVFGVPSMVPSNVQKGRDPILLGSSSSNQVSGAFDNSRMQKQDTLVTSSAQHLHPIQPAMLLSPPRQKDRRDFIKPPGYQSQPQTAVSYGPTRAGMTATSISSNLSGSLKASAHQSQALSVERRSQFSSGLNHPLRGKDPPNQSGHPSQQPLLNNYTSNLNGEKEGAPSVISVDSSSTRYLSLPSDHGKTNVIKNVLHPETFDNASRNYQRHGHLGRVGPNGQDHQQQQHPSRNGYPMTMETVYEASLDGSVEPGGEDTSVDLNEKIASLSRQRVEAQARLEQLKEVYGGETSVTAPQRPTTSGGEAADNRISAKYTGVLIGDSPPVSPIARELPSQRPVPTGTSNIASKGKTIHVSMPKLNELEISATSTPASKRTSIGSGSPSPSINQNDWKTPIKDSPGKEQFFALKAHIST